MKQCSGSKGWKNATKLRLKTSEFKARFQTPNVWGFWFQGRFKVWRLSQKPQTVGVPVLVAVRVLPTIPHTGPKCGCAAKNV